MTNDLEAFSRQIAGTFAEQRKQLELSAIGEQGGYYLPMPSYGSPVNITTTGHIYIGTLPRTCSILSWRQSTLLFGAVDVSNYWTVSLLANAVTLHSFNPVHGGGVWLNNNFSFLASPLEVTDVNNWLAVFVTKVGNPPILSLVGPLVYVVGS